MKTVYVLLLFGGREEVARGWGRSLQVHHGSSIFIHNMIEDRDVFARARFDVI
jgi:hypothetical protein